MKTKDHLYTVTATFTFVVEAGSFKQANHMARDYARDAFVDLSVDNIDCIVEPGVKADGWDDDCIPYGGDGNTRTGEYK